MTMKGTSTFLRVGIWFVITHSRAAETQPRTAFQKYLVYLRVETNNPTFTRRQVTTKPEGRRNTLHRDRDEVCATQRNAYGNEDDRITTRRACRTSASASVWQWTNSNWTEYLSNRRCFPSLTYPSRNNHEEEGEQKRERTSSSLFVHHHEICCVTPWPTKYTNRLDRCRY